MAPTPVRQLPGGVGMGSVADSDSSSDSSIDEAETAAVEMLLEAYFMQVDNTFNRLQVRARSNCALGSFWLWLVVLLPGRCRRADAAVCTTAAHSRTCIPPYLNPRRDA